MLKYLRKVKNEFQKISFLKRKEVIRVYGVVMVLIAVCVGVFFLVNYASYSLISLILDL